VFKKLRFSVIAYNLGHVAVAFEAGQHGTRAAVQAHERALWRTLLAAGLIEFGDLPDQIRRRVGRLGSSHSEPRLVEIVHRHVVGPNDAFVMRPGFENLQRIRAGDVLARDRNGDIASEYNGRILMPLYQSQGDDGFFIVRDLHPVWLPVSAFCRRLGLGALVVYLPGVRRHPTLADAVIVDRRIPRWIVTRIFHLLGYGKWSEDAHAIVMRWRRETPRRRSSQ
jgi:succinylglutamate desuccinylase